MNIGPGAFIFLFSTLPAVGVMAAAEEVGQFQQWISGLGGLAGLAAFGGVLLAWRKQTQDKRAGEQANEVSLREATADELRAAFPGGVGDIIAHWRSEYGSVTEQLEITRGQLEKAQIELYQEQVEVKAAKARIRELEQEVDNLGGKVRDQQRRIRELEVAEQERRGPS